MSAAEEDIQVAVADIARQLGETEPGAIAQIDHIVQALGTEKTCAF